MISSTVAGIMKELVVAARLGTIGSRVPDSEKDSLMHKCDQALIFGKETVGRIRSYLIFQKSILRGHLKFRIMAISLRTGTTRMMMRAMSPSTAGSKRLRIRIRAHRTNRHLLASKKR